MSHLRIPVGVWILTLLFLAPFPLIAATSPRLIIGENGMWTTTAVLSSATGASVPLSNCIVGPVPTATLTAHGTAVVAQLGDQQCNLINGFGSLALDPEADVVAYSVLTFANGSDASHFAVPALDFAISGTETGVIERVVNAGDERAYIVALNVGDHTTAIRLEVHDGADHFIASQYALAAPGVTLIPLAAELPAGRLIVGQGYIGFGPSPDPSMVYAFAAMGPASGLSQRVEVMTAP